MNKVYRGQKQLLAYQFSYSVLKSLDADLQKGVQDRVKEFTHWVYQKENIVSHAAG